MLCFTCGESKVWSNFKKSQNIMSMIVAIVAKGFLKLSKMVVLIKTKESITSQKLGSRDLWGIANSVPNKGKSAIPPLFNSPEVLSSSSNNQSCMPKTFLRTLILMSHISLYRLSLLELTSGCK